MTDGPARKGRDPERIGDTTSRVPRIKICGLTRLGDAQSAEEAGADYLGFVLSAGFSRSLEPSLVGDIVRGTMAARVAVLVNEPPERAIELACALEADVVQLHGHESVDTARVVAAAGDWRVWKAVRARTVEDVRRTVLDFGAAVHGVLVEGYRDGAVGGAGLVVGLPPAEVRASVQDPLRFILAGGLTPQTVGEAVRRFRPDVVDVSSGVDAEVGRKDPAAVRAFIANARVDTIR